MPQLRSQENFWRPNYEARAAFAWAAAMLVSGLALVNEPTPQQPVLFLNFVAGVFFVLNAWPAWCRWLDSVAIAGRGIEFIRDANLLKHLKVRNGHLWMGRGFEWTASHTQKLYDIKRVDIETLYPPRWTLQLWQSFWADYKIAVIQDNYIGAPWIHGLEPAEKDLYVPFEHFIGNTFILGINRCGKTRMLELIVEMAIAMGHTVISIDPKGDQEYEKTMRLACKATGREKDFTRFHLAFPRSSIRLDPLKNYTNPSDLPSRIAALMGGGDDDPFQKFAWNVLNSVILGMLEVDEKPTLAKIRTYVEIGVTDLLLRAVIQYYDRRLPPTWEGDIADFAKTIVQGKKRGQDEGGEVLVRQNIGLLLKYYVDVLVPRGHDNEAIKALSAIYKHDSAHYSKMIANLIPIMTMLTTGELGPLLSPDPMNTDDTRAMSDLQALIDSRAVVYIGLDALANRTISSAVGSMLLSDLTSVASNIYNYRPESAKSNKVVLIVDETAVVVNDPFIELLNKAPGAGFVTFAATQTVPDLATRFNSMDKARQMLGNFNNLVAMRLKDKTTMEYVVETFGQTYVSSLQKIATNATNTEKNALHFSASMQERQADTLEEMVPPDIFVAMPNWQYIGSFSGGRIVKGRLPIIQHGEDH